MLTFVLFIATSLAADVPELVVPDASVLAALPLEQREALLNEQLVLHADREGEERLLTALLVSQRLGGVTSADSPELESILADALSSDSRTRLDALQRARSLQGALGSRQASPASDASAESELASAFRGEMLRAPSGMPLSRAWRQLETVYTPPLPQRGVVFGTWKLKGSDGTVLDVLDLARVLQLGGLEKSLVARRRVVWAVSLGGVVALAAAVTLGIFFISPFAVASLTGLGAAGGGLAFATPLWWSVHKKQFDRWFDRDDLSRRIDAHNAYWAPSPPRRDTEPPVIDGLQLDVPPATVAPGSPLAPVRFRPPAPSLPGRDLEDDLWDVEPGSPDGELPGGTSGTSAEPSPDPAAPADEDAESPVNKDAPTPSP